MKIENINEQIKNRLKESGMKAKDLAARLGITPNVVSRWVNGKLNPSSRTLSKIAEILDTDFIIHNPKKFK